MYNKVEYDRKRYKKVRIERIKNTPKDILYSISKIDRAYIAGLIDGEGSIHMTRKGKTKTFHVFVVVGMTNKEVIEWLANKYGNKAIESIRVPIREFQKKPKNMYYVRLEGRRACLLCKILLPYLKVKRKQAEILMKYPYEGRTGAGKKLYGSKINNIRIDLKNELTLLNGNYYQYRHEK